MATLTSTWRRRQPEATALHRVLADHLATFLAQTFDDETRNPLPRFVVRELRDFLDCGQLSRGFCRVYCEASGKNELVAFSCKRRGICPSCGARRMADTAAWLIDRVIPDVPVRQWVLSLPHRVRYACAFDYHIAQQVRAALRVTTRSTLPQASTVPLTVTDGGGRTFHVLPPTTPQLSRNTART